MDREKIVKKISSLDHTKACQESDIPTKIIKENADIFSEVFRLSFNASANEGTFPSVFKLADVTLIFKKGSKNSKDNYRPISILKSLTKLNPHDFSLSALRLICSCLFNRQQRTKVNASYSCW